MPNHLTHRPARHPFGAALLAASLLLTPLATAAPAAAQQEESSLFMRVYVESVRTCPTSNIGGYTSIVIEGKGVPDAEGYIPATAHGITDLARRGNLTLHTSHYEGDYPLAVRLKTQVIGLNQTIQVLDFEPLALNPNPKALMCSYIDGDGSTKQIYTDEDYFFRQMINTSKLMTSVLEGFQENSEGVLGVEGVATNGIGLIKIAAQWFPGKPWANMQVEPDAKGLFINNVEVDINMDYTPNWGEPARYDGLVSIKPGPLPWEKIPQGAPTKVRRTLKPAGMQPGSSPSEGFVDLTSGGTTSNRASTPYRVSGPQVVVAKDEVGATKSNNEVVYKYERAIPKEPWKREFVFGPTFPPPLRGKEIEASAQLKILFETTSLMPPATIKPGFGGEGEVTLGKVAGKLAVEGNAELKIDESGVDFVQGNGKADFQIGVKSTYGLFDVVPQVQPAAAAVGLENWVNKYFRIEAGLYGIAVGQLVVYKKDGLQWKAQVQPGVRVTAKGVIGAEGGDIGAEVEAKGEGRLNFFLNDPDKDFYGGGDGEITFAAALSFFNNKFIRESKYSFGGSLASLGQTLQADSPVIVSTLASNGYTGGEQWQPVDNTALNIASSLIDSRTTLVAHAHPYALPSMDPTGHAACWVSARAGITASRNTEIVCTTGAALAAATPMTVTNDALADSAPSVAMAAANKPVAAWWRHDDPTLPISATLDTNYMRHGEVMASAYDPVGVKWTTPITLGTPNVLDYDPVVVGDANTGAIVVWRANTAGQIGGLAGTPDVLKAATFTSASNTWSAAQTVATLPGLLEVSAAYFNGEAAVMYSIDSSNAATHTLNAEVWAQRRLAGTWQPAVRLSNNSVADTSPLVAYDATGTPVFVWLRTDANAATSLVLQRGWNGTPIVKAMTGENAPTELRRMALNAQGDVAVLWRSLSGNDQQQDLSYARFSAASQTWSAATRLTNEPDEKRFASIAWSSANQITLFYDQVKLQTLTGTVVISGAVTPYTYTTPNVNGHNLVLHTIDVAGLQAQQAQQISNSTVNTPTLPELSIVSTTPDRELQRGSTMLRVKVANTGVVSAANVLVQVRDASGDIGEAYVVVTPTEGLRPGTNSMAYVPLQVGEVESDTRDITVTVSAKTATLEDAPELNTANNTAELGWMRWPDWSLADGTVLLGKPTAAGTPVTITAYNLSEVNAPAVGISVYTDRPESGGVLLWTGTLGEAEPLQRSKVSTLLPGAVTRVYVRVNPNKAVAELSSGNNDGRAGGVVVAAPTGYRLLMPVLQK